MKKRDALKEAIADAAELLDAGPGPTESIYVWRSKVDDWLSRPEVVAARALEPASRPEGARTRTVAELEAELERAYARVDGKDMALEIVRVVRDDAQLLAAQLDRAIEEAALIWEAYLPLESLQKWLANPVVVAARERARLAGPPFDVVPDDVPC